eukprot:Hpha_TRINITY_DN26847_c0_g1::TRINITY_DN26847_c0_g1_i1::g.17301::m.17301
MSSIPLRMKPDASREALRLPSAKPPSSRPPPRGGRPAQQAGPRRRANSASQQPSNLSNISHSSTTSAEGRKRWSVPRRHTAGPTSEDSGQQICRLVRHAAALEATRPMEALVLLQRVVNDCERRQWPVAHDAQRAAVAACVNCANLLVRDSQYLRAAKLYTRALNGLGRLPGLKLWRWAQGLLVHNAAVALGMQGDHAAAAQWLRQIPDPSLQPFSLLLLRHLDQRTLTPQTVPPAAMLGSLTGFGEEGPSVPPTQRPRHQVPPLDAVPAPVPPATGLPRTGSMRAWGGTAARDAPETTPAAGIESGLPRVRPATARQRPQWNPNAANAANAVLPPHPPPRPYTTAALARAAGGGNGLQQPVAEGSSDGDNGAEIIDDGDGDTPDCWDAPPHSYTDGSRPVPSRPTTAPRRRSQPGPVARPGGPATAQRPSTAGASRTRRVLDPVPPAPGTPESPADSP